MYVYTHVRVCIPSHGLARNAMKSGSVLIHRHVLPRRAEQSGCHLPLQWRRGLLGRTLVRLLMTVLIADKKTEHISEENVATALNLHLQGCYRHSELTA